MHTRGDLVRGPGGKEGRPRLLPLPTSTIACFQTAAPGMIGNDATTVAYLAGRVTAAEQAVAAIDTFT